MNPDTPGSLEEQVRELRLRLTRIEEALHNQGILSQQWRPTTGDDLSAAPPAAPAAVVGPAQVAAEAPPPAVAEAPPMRPLFAASGSAPLEDHRSLESRIGSQWFNRVGILAVLIGMAWFLKFAIDNHWIGPLGRVLIGLVAGGLSSPGQSASATMDTRLFSYSLKAIGSGVLYLSLWAAFSLFHLVPSGVAFAAMIAVTAFNAYMAWAQDAELLALYAIVGGLSTPLLLSTGGNHEITLFTYLLLLDIAVLVLVCLRPWSRLLFGAFVGTVLFITGMVVRVLLGRTSVANRTFHGLLLPDLCLCSAAGRDQAAGRRALERVGQPGAGDRPVANAALGFLAYYAMLDRPEADWAQPWLAVAFAAFYLLMLRLPAQGRLKASPELLSALHLSAAVVFLTIAIPLKASGRWITIGWLVEGAALLWVAVRTRMRLLRALAVLCLVLGLGALVTINPAAAATPIFNQRFGAYLVAIAVFAFAAWLAAREPADAAGETFISSPALAALAVLAVNALILARRQP